MFSRIKPHVILGTSRAVKAANFSTHYSVALKKKYFTSRTADVPSSASVIVVGGGIIGTSVAYHLAKRGIEDVLLLERDKLTSGTTWHAAGLMVTYGSLSATSTEMRKYSKELYSRILPEETGDMDCCGFKPCGFIELCTSPEDLEYNRRVAAFNRFMGVDVREISPEEVTELFPLVDVIPSERNQQTGILAGFYIPTDGRVNPYDTAMALAKAGKKKYGVEIRENCPVMGITTTNDAFKQPKVSGVTLADGIHIEAKRAVINCAGMWARQLGQSCGIHSIPNQAAEHYYLITEPMPNVDPNWPVVEDTSRYTYIRPEGGGLMVGLFEGEGAPWNIRSIPEDFSFGQITPDWERMTPYLERAMSVVPATLDVGAKHFFCGPESFTPDNAPIIGPAPELRNYYVAAGLNSIGILSGGGVGRLVAEWVDQDGISPKKWDVTGIHINRFHKYQSNPKYRTDRVKETLANVYKLHFPDFSPATCRNIKRSPLHELIKKRQNPFFRDVSGWESPAWYAPQGCEEALRKPNAQSFGREHWFQYWKAEHEACRNNVALFDMSFMSKFLVQGKDAGNFLNRLCTADVDKECGKITYTQWLNEYGHMEADVTVTKLNEDRFLVVATDTQLNHVEAHMKTRIKKEDSVIVDDVTGSFALISIQGPSSRKLLQSVTSQDMSQIAFPFRCAKEIDIEYGRVLCTRITYVGELGYELLIPTEISAHVYEALTAEQGKNGLRHAGLRALGSLRMEKAYRDYGHDMDNTDTLLECGLSFTCDFDKPGGFIGMDHVQQQRQILEEEGGLRKRMVQVLVKDPEPLLHHGEILWRNGSQAVCEIRSASYGHTLGGAVGLAMLESDCINKDYIASSTWEVETPTGRYPCEISLSPLYDPKNRRINV